jgi:4-amino-4-deoxy-L-arabinose transferase-like glycosyltransferase
MFCTVAYLTDNRWRWLLIGGTALGLAILVRPIAYYLPPTMGLALTLRALLSGDRRWTKCLQAAALVAVAWGPAWAWQGRNHAVAGYDRFAAIEDVNLYFYTSASVLARQQGIPVTTQNIAMGASNPAVYFSLHPEQSTWTNVERYNYMRREGLKVLRANLGQYFVIHIEGIVPLLLGGGASETIQLLGLDHQARNQDAADREFTGVIGYAYRLMKGNLGLFCCNVVLSLIALGFLAAAAFGAFSRASVARLPLLFLLCIAAYFCALSGGPSGRPRYRHPAMPVVCLFAAEGARRLAAWRQRDRRKEVPTPLVTEDQQLLAA